MSLDMFPDSAIQYLIDHEDDDMAQHDEPYEKAPENTGKLGADCGHHCGVITVGGNDQHVGHCNCPECHGDPRFDNTLSQLSGEKGGVDPRGIV